MPSMDLTPEEARHIIKRRRSSAKDEVYRQALEAAAREAISWADQSGGGSGQGGDGYRNLAAAILRLKRARNTKKKEG